MPPRRSARHSRTPIQAAIHRIATSVRGWKADRQLLVDAQIASPADGPAITAGDLAPLVARVAAPAARTDGDRAWARDVAAARTLARFPALLSRESVTACLFVLIRAAWHQARLKSVRLPLAHVISVEERAEISNLYAAPATKPSVLLDALERLRADAVSSGSVDHVEREHRVVRLLLEPTTTESAAIQARWLDDAEFRAWVSPRLQPSLWSVVAPHVPPGEINGFLETMQRTKDFEGWASGPAFRETMAILVARAPDAVRPFRLLDWTDFALYGEDYRAANTGSLEYHRTVRDGLLLVPAIAADADAVHLLQTTSQMRVALGALLRLGTPDELRAGFQYALSRWPHEALEVVQDPRHRLTSVLQPDDFASAMQHGNEVVRRLAMGALAHLRTDGTLPIEEVRRDRPRTASTFARVARSALAGEPPHVRPAAAEAALPAPVRVAAQALLDAVLAHAEDAPDGAPFDLTSASAAVEMSRQTFLWLRGAVDQYVRLGTIDGAAADWDATLESSSAPSAPSAPAVVPPEPPLSERGPSRV